MSKKHNVINIDIDADNLTFWQALKIRMAIGDVDKTKIQHENTGAGWIAIAIIVAALIVKGVT